MLNEITKMPKPAWSKASNRLPPRSAHWLRQCRLQDSIKVNYYGLTCRCHSRQRVGGSDARSILITPWEKQMVGAVERPFWRLIPGLTPNTAGNYLAQYPGTDRAPP